MSNAGYQGSELGPPGFFGTPEQVSTAFAGSGLSAVGVYAPVHFSADELTVEKDLAGIELSCKELVACAGAGVVILADEGSQLLLSNPARGDGTSLGLDKAGWHRLVVAARRAAELVAGYGLTISFHPHISTFVESRHEIERLLELTELSLTIDTGHLLLAGADPAQCVRDWGARVNHVHIKDVRVDVLQRAKAAQRQDFDTWWAEVCTPLGDGDVDIEPVLEALASLGYRGWLVVEQDRAPTAAEDYPAVMALQAANRAWLAHLAAHFWAPPQEPTTTSGNRS
jgi:inosose dehydratase